MNRLLISTLCIGLALLPGCAITPPGESTPPTETRSEPEWPAARAALGAALQDTHGIEAHAMDDGALLLRLPAAEGFARDSVEPTSMLRALLDDIIPLLSTADTDLLILGHTDSMGSELHNLDLSIRRAEAVAEYLRAQGVALRRLSADGRGEAEPIADNATPSGRATNRRVEVIVRPVPPRRP